MLRNRVRLVVKLRVTFRVRLRVGARVYLRGRFRLGLRVRVGFRWLCLMDLGVRLRLA